MVRKIEKPGAFCLPHVSTLDQNEKPGHLHEHLHRCAPHQLFARGFEKFYRELPRLHPVLHLWLVVSANRHTLFRHMHIHNAIVEQVHPYQSFDHSIIKGAG
jgi:hypothetical protein